MSTSGEQTLLDQINEELRAASSARKCHGCGCFQNAVTHLTDALPRLRAADRERLEPVLHEATTKIVARKYECLGCEVCWPANALNAAAEIFPPGAVGGDGCPTDSPPPRQGWPPLPGDYKVLDVGGDIAVCALTSQSLVDALAETRPQRVAIIGSLYTENLGIERIITNILASPNLTTLVLCGADSQQRMGHRPGQSLLSLMEHGVDEGGRILHAQGRRPVLRNLARETIASFRHEIRVVDRLGEDRPDSLCAYLADLPASIGPPRTPESWSSRAPVVSAGPPARLVLDPEGYFVVFPDRSRSEILVEHYENNGALAHVIHGQSARDLFTTITGRGLISRLDHAAYLGAELARAEMALTTGEAYVQDEAPEPACGAGCGCRRPEGEERKEKP